MQVRRNKFLNILLILQTALATLTQTRSEDLAEEEKRAVFDFLTSSNPSCQTFHKKFGSLEKMQWLIGFYIENMKTILESPNGTGMEDEQPNKFSETLLEINERFNRARKGICRSISDQCTDNTSVDEEYEIMTTVFESTVKDMSELFVEIDKCKKILQEKQASTEDAVKLYETGTQPLKSILRLKIKFKGAIDGLVWRIEKRTYPKRISQCIETIGYFLSSNLEKEFELLDKFHSSTDKETLYSKFKRALMNLQAVFAYFIAWDEQETVTAMINNAKKSRKMICNDYLVMINERITDLFIDLQKQAKKYEDAAKDKVDECLKVPADPSNVIGIDFDKILKSLLGLQVTNANDENIKQNIDFFIKIIRSYRFRYNTEQMDDEEFDLDKHLFSVFTTHLSTYRRLLLEIDANNKEKDFAHAEFIKISSYLTHMMFKARKALFALEKMNVHNISESDKITIATFPHIIAQAIGTVYTLKKTENVFFEEQAKILDEKIVLLQKYGEGLKEKVLGLIARKFQNIRMLGNIDVNPNTSVFTTTNGNKSTNTNGKTANFSKTFRDDHESIKMFLLKLLNLRRERLDAKKRCNDFIELAVRKYIVRSCTEMQTDLENLEWMGKEICEIVFELSESNNDGIEDCQDIVESRNPNLIKERLVKILKAIYSAFFARSKKIQLQIDFIALEEKTSAIFKHISGQEKLAAFALYSFIRLEICHDIISLISKENNFIKRVQNTLEYKIALEKSRGNREIVFGRTLYDKLFGGQKDENQELDRAEKEVSSALSNFFEVYANRAKVNDDTSIVTIKDNDKTEITAVLELILDCFSNLNGLRDVKEIDVKTKILESWIKKNVHKMQHLHAFFDQKTDVKRITCNT